MDHQETPEGYTPYPPYPTAEQVSNNEKLKHSGVGIASFMINLLAFMGYVGGFLTAAAAVGRLAKIGDSTEVAYKTLINTNSFVIGVIVILICFILNIIGLILSVIGLATGRRKKLYAILGLIFGLLPATIVVLLFTFNYAIMGR